MQAMMVFGMWVFSLLLFASVLIVLRATYLGSRAFAVAHVVRSATVLALPVQRRFAGWMIFLLPYALMLIFAVGGCNIAGMIFWWGSDIWVPGPDGGYGLRFAVMMLAFFAAPAFVDPLLRIAYRADDALEKTDVDYLRMVLDREK
jgi:hypothetical protein